VHKHPPDRALQRCVVFVTTELYRTLTSDRGEMLLALQQEFRPLRGREPSLWITSRDMSTDDEILFGQVRDDSTSSFLRVQYLVREPISDSSSRELALTLAEFELHGATMWTLTRWYPDDQRVRHAFEDWDSFNRDLMSLGLSTGMLDPVS
jgi:hypothetical protein